ncbi:MAG: hypothetical protein ABSA39_19105 [Edaphobacter sp.]
MTDFSREFPINCLTDTVLKKNSWFTDLLFRWHPAGDAVNSRLGDGKAVLARDCVNKGELQNLRVAFRGGYMNFYCGGQSIAKVEFGRDGLQAKIHEKYVYGCESTGKKYVKLTSKGFLEPGKGQFVPYDDQHLKKWIENANNKVGPEKRFVDLVVAHNPDVIDLEMGLPAYIPEERRAPRMDLVALEPHEGGWRVVLWEVKRVGDGRARCEGDKQPEVLEQLEAYTKWLRYGDHESRVAEAYQNNCGLLVGLHAIAKCVRRDIEELGPGIRAVANSNATPPSIDVKPRLLIIYDKKNESFRENGHFDKLKGAGLRVEAVVSLSELALCGQS